MGGTTYGTGVSQEAQLVSDVSSLVSLGGRKETKRIAYDARPGLLPPPGDATLPPPAERAGAGQDGYFPVNPEEQKSQRVFRGDIAGTRVDESLDGANDVEATTRNDAVEMARHNQITDRNYGNEFVEGRASKKTRQEILQRRAEAKSITGAGPRRYLTEPKSTYRTPTQTAAVGEVGDRISTVAQQPKTHNDFERSDAPPPPPGS